MLTSDPNAGSRPRPSQPARCATVLAVLLAFVGVAAAPGVAQELPPDPDSTRAYTMSVEDGFSVGSVGDIIIARPVSQNDDSRFTRMADVLQRADVAFGNFEGSAFDIDAFDGYPAAEYGGAWLIGVPAVAEDLGRLGFDMLSRANNHTTDWGVEGMEATSRVLDEAGLVHAGSGHDLAAARSPKYFETPKGRVAVVSIASSFTPMSRAADPQGEAPGRPGLSALRTDQYALVTAEEMEVLRGVKQAQPEATGDDEEEENEDELSLFGVDYRVGDGRGVVYEMNENDLQAFLHAIRDAKRSSDFVIATIHAHEPGNWSDEPPAFLEELAHRAIEAGADQFVGHGPHQLRGIEIYEGKPIFYSLANFLFQVELQHPVGRGMYEQFGLTGREMTDPEFNRRWLDQYFDDQKWYESVIAETRFEDGEVSEIRLHPVELGFENRGAKRGVPRIARPGEASRILEALAELSEPYGTEISIEDGVGVIRR